ncbi:MAG: DUF4249 domain-containing protein, partial [Cyclobacteriaceae bacterium]
RLIGKHDRIRTAPIVFSSCEKVIDPTLEDAEPILVVDAWLDNIPDKPQFIHLTMTQPYFDDSTPPGVSGASVVVTDEFSSTFVFVDDGSNTGTYVWSPPPGKSIGSVGTAYTLAVTTNGETFTATTTIKRTAIIDSITFKIKPAFQFPEGSYIAEFWSTDPKGPGDTYWIKAYKNNVFLNKPSEINIAYDAGFSAGGDFDNATFIPPIREAINPVDKDPNNQNKNLPPYVAGDSIRVDICSISLAAFDHLQQIVEQTNRRVVSQSCLPSL